MNYNYIQCEVSNGVGHLRLNRPEVLNAFHLPMYEEIAACISTWDSDDSVRSVLISGNGRAFCSGRDFRYSADLQVDDAPEAWRRAYRTFFPYTTGCTKVIVAAVQGYALGGGASLALGADITVAAPDAVFGYPETRHGIASKSMLWAWLLGPKVAKEVVATGRLVAVGEIDHLGLVSAIVAPDDLLAHAYSVAEDVAKMPYGIPPMVKRQINWATRDQARVSYLDRIFDVETAHWDKAGVEPSKWLRSARDMTEAANLENEQ